MEARVDARSSAVATAPRASRSQGAPGRRLTAGSFAAHSAALDVLASHRVQMERSRSLLARARAALSRLDAAPPAYPPVAATRDAEVAGPAGSAGGRGCMLGCSRPAPFQPCFVVGYRDRRVLLRARPLRVCAYHRAALDLLFRRCSALEALGEGLRGRVDGAPAVQVLFELTG